MLGVLSFEKKTFSKNNKENTRAFAAYSFFSPFR